ncbi:DUF2180 family protein [Streptomyces sp. x-19]|uniref:DUF2180 family protein n=1 Tax=Streptomyces sp. x-19 TaxID=2789280 RepID=UPI00398075EB
MHCLECRLARMTSTAVGVCRGCGAGVCGNHVHTATVPVRRGPVLGPPPEAVVRQVLCPACALATASGAGAAS